MCNLLHDTSRMPQNLDKSAIPVDEAFETASCLFSRSATSHVLDQTHTFVGRKLLSQPLQVLVALGHRKHTVADHRHLQHRQGRLEHTGHRQGVQVLC